MSTRPIIFSTCWYQFKCKNDPTTFQLWMHNMLSNVEEYYLVIYTDNNSESYVRPYADANPQRIRIVIKPMEEFYGYRYKDHWICNHTWNYLLNHRVEWNVNMLWAEKIHFVCETIENQYFMENHADAEAYTNANSDTNTQYYGWCDIGYFRCRPGMDFTREQLVGWGHPEKVQQLNIKKIHYACVNNDKQYINQLVRCVNHRGENGLPVEPIPPNQTSVAGGFFVGGVEVLMWWRAKFDETLQKYFENGYLVKDDQIIVADCVYSNMSRFVLHKETTEYDNWFMFQRILSMACIEK
jgi:hypothetical protein